MRKLKVGDRVRVKPDGPYFSQYPLECNRRGTIVEVTPSVKYPYELNLDSGGKVFCKRSEILRLKKKVTPPKLFTFVEFDGGLRVLLEGDRRSEYPATTAIRYYVLQLVEAVK